MIVIITTQKGILTKMKKSSLVVLLASLAMLASCVGTSSSLSSSSEAPVEQVVLFGVGHKAKYSIKGTVPAATTVQTDVTFLSALFDSDGVVLDVNVDVMQVKAAVVDATTASITSAVNSGSDVKSKWELGEDYGMGGSATKGEWYVQASAWENYAVGKTAAEVAAGTESDELLASVTVTTTDFAYALTEAWHNIAVIKTTEPESLHVGLGMFSSHAALTTTVSLTGAAFLGAEVVSSTVDCFQIPYLSTNIGTVEVPVYSLTVPETGKVQVAKKVTCIESKVELHDLYGMVGTTVIYGDWYQQAANLEAFVLGKTVAAAFTGVSETGEFTDPTIASVSITVSDFALTYAEAYTVSQSTTR